MSTRRNAIIMAAGTSSRFVPLSYEKPKGLLEVKGEVLIERLIRQLREAGINDITIVVGYKAELFKYLKEKYDVSLVLNEDFECYNNTSSVIRVLDRLGNTFLCCSDNYFPKNVFMEEETESFYSALFAEGDTSEYCLTTNSDGYITDVKIGGHDAWYMVGHVYFNKDFSSRFSHLLEQEYTSLNTRLGYWEDVYIRHLQELPMKIHKYQEREIFEFDSLDELRQFDKSYITDTRSAILKEICNIKGWQEKQLGGFQKMKQTDTSLLFSFQVDGFRYLYDSTKKDKVEKA